MLVLVTLKDFLTRTQWGDHSLFKDLRSAAQFMLDNSDSGFKSATSLATLLGQVSGFDRGASKRLEKGIREAVAISSANWPENLRKVMLRDLDEVFTVISTNISRKSTKSESSGALFRFEQVAYEGNSFVVVLTETLHLYYLLFTPPLDIIFHRLLEGYESASSSNEHIYPQITILVPQPHGQFMAYIAVNKLIQKFPDKRKQLQRLSEISKLRIFEIDPIACWSSAVIADIDYPFCKGFHIYFENHPYETRLSQMSNEISITSWQNFHNRLDYLDDPLQKKEILISWPPVQESL